MVQHKLVAALSALALIGAPAIPGLRDARADEPSAPRGVNLRGTDGTETSDTIQTFDCSFVVEGEPLAINYRKIACRFSTTGISRPTATQVVERLREFDSEEYQKDLRSKLPKLCTKVGEAKAKGALTGVPEAERAQFEMLASACARKDVGAQVAAMRYSVSEVWANTCKVFNYGTREYEFRQVDESTWRGMDSTLVDGSATMKTIWRKKVSETFAPWNYKQVTSADPRCVPQPARPCSSDGTDEWTFDARSKLTGCRYFD
jgi:hypothetical protein